MLGYQGLNFDAAEYDFNFYQLFRENRFAGVDRLSDANNITPALTTRLISQDSGLERLRLSVGKVFYITDPQVVMTLNAPQVTYKNNLISEISSKLNPYWTFTGTGQYIWGGWYAIGRWQYSLVSNITVEALAGLEKETCCWRFSLFGLRYQNGAASQTGIVTTSNTITTNSAIYFQLEFKGLGSFGDQVDNLLLQNFSGYRTDYALPGLYTQPQQAYN